MLIMHQIGPVRINTITFCLKDGNLPDGFTSNKTPTKLVPKNNQIKEIIVHNTYNSNQLFIILKRVSTFKNATKFLW